MPEQFDRKILNSSWIFNQFTILYIVLRNDFSVPRSLLYCNNDKGKN